MIRFLLILSIAIMIAITSGTDYCSESLCKPGQKHVACEHSGEFSPSCPEDAKMVDIDSDLKEVLLDGHNEKRNLVAGGSAPGHDPACRMATMEWDDELAYLASLNVRKCQTSHDECYNTDTFKFSGQNLYWTRSTDLSTDYAEHLKKAVEAWYNEVQYSNETIIDKYPPYYKGPAIGHFTVMVNDANIRLGCGAATYTEDAYMKFLVACNYARTNLWNLPVYARCSEPASQCTTGTNPDYPNLCSVDEIYDAN